ncbi:glycosyltransferase family 2 protein [Kaistia terrae]|uniref:Glycosyltransferase family 2 protein n=1 Tax=Kaistia terrae TaxID=537017 RepID=A0ABW0PRC2_9HYPH|nr:glycosyltransferase family 2 protein [Kaistia terrae]MCX5578133.1 glycosyltransferase family 2 protein [Kaistia terrae]
MRLVVLLQARNEQRFLPGWLENVAPAVDGIIALDDGSEDATAEILAGHPKLIQLIRNPVGQPWSERGNHIALIKAARQHGAEWLLCVDADERLEQRFAGDIAQILDDADTKGIEAYSLQLRELWNDRSHYRKDGIWGRKARYRLFRNDPRHTKFDPRPLHRYWMPLDIVTRLASVGAHLPHNLYHLRMVRAEDRQARHQRYVTLDPDNRYQPQGYDYLVDETGMELATIPPERDFLPRRDSALFE